MGIIMNLIDFYVGSKNVFESKTGSDYLIIRDRTAGQIRKLVCEDTDTDEESDKKNRKLEGQITQKLKAGKPLTPKELAFLKKYNATLYRYAVIAETKRKCVENQLKNCRSKEDVQKVQENAMSEVDLKSPVGEFISQAANYAIDEFKKSEAYSKLPATNKEAQSQEAGKKKKISNRIEDDKKNDLQDYQKDGAKSDISKSNTSKSDISKSNISTSGAGEGVAYNISFGSYQEAYVSGGTSETMNMLS